jgi:hypothetical protein
MLCCYVVLDGVIVVVLAIGLKVRRFKPGRERWVLRAIKFLVRLPLEGK